MIRCLVTATSASRRLLDANEMSADQLLIDAINQGAEHGRDVTLVNDPEAAEVILFAESHRNDDAIRHVLRDPLYRDFHSKCVVHCGMDHPMPLIPGLYPSINQHWARRLCCDGSPYLASLNPYIGSIDPAEIEVDQLASFMGACEGKAVRMRLLSIAARDNWANVVVRDTGPAFVGSIRSGDEKIHHILKQQFAVDLLKSKFVLCPSGAGSSSFRIFEAMQSGRSPVVIADDWTPPPGPDWGSFLIRIPVSHIPHIPQILQQKSDQWKAMGAVAREQWERYYGPASFGPEIIGNAIEILAKANAHPYRRAFNAWFYVNGPRRLSLLRNRLVDKGNRILKKFARQHKSSSLCPIENAREKSTLHWQ